MQSESTHEVTVSIILNSEVALPSLPLEQITRIGNW